MTQLNPNEKPSLTMALKQYFGMKPEQKISEFAEELKRLTPKDKQELKEMLQAIGIETKE